MTISAGFLTLCSVLACAQAPDSTTPPAQKAVGPKTAAPAPKPAVQPKSPAEQIADLRENIKLGEQAVAKLTAELENPTGEYKSAERDFEQLNEKLKAAKLKVTKLTAEGKAAEAKAVEGQIAVLDEDWKLARERFDIAIQKQLTRREALVNLRERVAADRKRLAAMEGKKPAGEPTTATAPPGETVAPNPRPVTPPATPKSPEPPKADTPTPAVVLPGLPQLSEKPAADPKPDGSPSAKTAMPDPASSADTPAVREIRDRIAQLRAAQTAAEDRLQEVRKRVRMQERSLQMAEKSKKLDQESLAQAQKAIARANEILAAKPPVPAEERQRAEKSRTDAAARVAEIKDRLQRIADRVVSLTETNDELQAEAATAATAVEQARAAVERAEAELATELSPTSVRNLSRWVATRGPRILLIVLVTLLLHLLVRQFSRQFVRLAARNNRRGSVADRENRLSTLIGVFRYVAGLVIFGGGTVSLLDTLGVPVGTIIGGAAVIGLAVAFGAQNLIRDYFTGFIMLLEDQYSVNDVVRIGTTAGLVEHISLRMTVLRDLEGVRHFIPHGGITSVSNLTHTWSRAMFDVAVAYKEDVDQVMQVLTQLARDMRADPAFGKDILEDPEMLGVDALGDSGVVIKFLLKTRPLQQWPIKRELLRRIKNRFDQLGIEIPFPHRTVYHRVADSDTASRLLGSLSAEQYA